LHQTRQTIKDSVLWLWGIIWSTGRAGEARVQEFKSSRVQEFKSSRVQELGGNAPKKSRASVRTEALDEING
jgi:hypothetical protein